MTGAGKVIIAVDGPAGTGKSSVCREVAADLGIRYIDSGAIYRGITWYFLDKYGNTPGSSSEVAEGLKDISLEQIPGPGGSVLTFVNGRDVSSLIREERIAVNIGFFSDIKDVRLFVNSLLRKWSGEGSIIMDGRDIGTVVFPDAEIKVYLDASVEVRTGRRVKEYLQMGKKVDEIIIKNQIIQRDLDDINREFGGLKRSEDALYIDTSYMPFDEVVLKMKSIIKDHQLNMIKNKV